MKPLQTTACACALWAGLLSCVKLDESPSAANCSVGEFTLDETDSWFDYASTGSGYQLVMTFNHGERMVGADLRRLSHGTYAVSSDGERHPEDEVRRWTVMETDSVGDMAPLQTRGTLSLAWITSTKEDGEFDITADDGRQMRCTFSLRRRHHGRESNY